MSEASFIVGTRPPRNPEPADTADVFGIHRPGAVSRAVSHTLEAHAREHRECGRRDERLRLEQDPLRALDVLDRALARMDNGFGCSEETALLAGRLRAYVLDDLATASKPDHCTYVNSTEEDA